VKVLKTLVRVIQKTLKKIRWNLKGNDLSEVFKLLSAFFGFLQIIERWLDESE
jgi:hypothetical protein